MIASTRFAALSGAALVLVGGAWAAAAWRSHQAPPPAPPTTPRMPAALAALEALQRSLPSEEPPRFSNPSAYLPAQCYAQTQDRRTHNSCFTCHQSSQAPNFVDDGDVQTTLSFARAAAVNRWSNALHPPRPAAIDDAALDAWVRTSNYFDRDGKIALASTLAHPPAAWDANHDGRFGGFVPDCWFHPDERGFDRAPDGNATGWRAYAWAPVPGQFWPTNGGSAGDAFIRLPEAYRQDAAGRESEAIYALNLAILEAMVRRRDVPIAPADERALGVDLDGDGALTSGATRVAYVWPPRDGRPFGYVGRAATLDRAKDGWPAAGLFPKGTEFLHSLRYLDVDGKEVRMGARMKELRYLRKQRWVTYAELELAATDEAREKQKKPDKLKTVHVDAERGAGTGTGWLAAGFLEDAEGALRPQTAEELASCVGCHGGVGAGNDSIFSFARKLSGDSPASGWYHWSQHGLAGTPEPKRSDGRGEYLYWLEQVGGGDDFRANDELYARFFGKDGHVKREMAQKLARDISTLIVPSPARARALDRAYLAIVRAQSFTAGRDVIVGSAPHILAEREPDSPTGIETAIR